MVVLTEEKARIYPATIKLENDGSLILYSIFMVLCSRSSSANTSGFDGVIFTAKYLERYEPLRHRRSDVVNKPEILSDYDEASKNTGTERASGKRNLARAKRELYELASRSSPKNLQITLN